MLLRPPLFEFIADFTQGERRLKFVLILYRLFHPCVKYFNKFSPQECFASISLSPTPYLII